MCGQIKISAALVFWIAVWNTRYWWENLPGFPELLINIGLFVALCILVVIALFQVYYTVKKILLQGRQTKKDSVSAVDWAKEEDNILKIINIVSIFITATLSYLYPLGLIDWSYLEPETILTAQYEGTANCTTTLRLKKGYWFKKTVVCFGVEHWEGRYQMVGDTVKFYYTNSNGASQINDFALLFPKNSSGYPITKLLHYYPNGHNSFIPMTVFDSSGSR